MILSVLADTASDIAPYTGLANYGILGLIAYALFTGRVVPAKLYERAIQDRIKEHEELMALRTKTEDQFIPAIIRNTELLTRLGEKATG